MLGSALYRCIRLFGRSIANIVGNAAIEQWTILRDVINGSDAFGLALAQALRGLNSN